MTMTAVRFDDSLPVMARVVTARLGADALAAGAVLRDAVGCLAFFAAKPLDQQTVDELSAELRRELGAYSRPDRVVAGPDDYGSAAVREDPSALTVVVGVSPVRLVDRRLVGADWLHAPAPPARPPPRFVFASLKGGVGRSTALAVTAAHLASRGKRVLAVDLDMEAPGLGALLLTEAALPEFGLLDALVENHLAALDETFYADLVGPSELAPRGGRIDVIPALGRRSLAHPADVLAKIARAYAEDVRPDGTVKSLLLQVQALIDRFAVPARYDAILIDARAGLHETTASAVLGLGAEVLLFGLDEPQTFHGYALMFAHLARFVPRGAPLPEWVERLTMVQGKAPADADARADFAQRSMELFSDAGLARPLSAPSGEVPLPAGPFKDVPWDDSPSDDVVLPSESPREPLAVLYGAQFQGFDPLRRRDVLADAIYRVTFGDLLAWVDEALKSAEGAS
jgi:hypothetical protein